MRKTDIRSFLLVGALQLLVSGYLYSDEAGLKALVQVLQQVDDSDFQTDVMKGMLDGLRGRKSVPMPDGWKAAYDGLSRSPNQDVQSLSLQLAVIFGDPRALAHFQKTLINSSASVTERRQALSILVEKRTPDLAPTLQALLKSTELRAGALRGLAAYDYAATPGAILSVYSLLSSSEKTDALATLSSRPAYALALLDAAENGKIERTEISAFNARQLADLGDPAVTKRLNEVWGQVRGTSADQQKKISAYKSQLGPKVLKMANLKNGRLLFNKTCFQCHTMYGEGGTIGPDITGSNRDNLDYILENVVTPSAFIGKGYELTKILMKDERLISGIVLEKTPERVSVQTLNEKLLLARSDIEAMKNSEISMMPEGLLDTLSKTEVRDLVGYLASPQQVPLD